MDYPHRINIQQLKNRVNSIEIQQLLERQSDLINKPWNNYWGFNAGDDNYPIDVIFVKEDEAIEFSKTLNELFGVIVDEPFTVKSRPTEESKDPLLTGVASYRYQLLARLKQDCLTYFDYQEEGLHSPKRLWALSEEKQIQAMKTLWDSFGDDEKPEWISMDEILNFETRFNELSAESSTSSHRPRP